MHCGNNPRKYRSFPSDRVFVLRGGPLRQFLDRLDADPAQDPVRGGVEDPDQWTGNGQVDQRRAGQPQRDRLGPGDRQVLRCQFAEDHLDDCCQQQRQDNRDGEADAFRQAGRTEQVLEALAQIGLGDIPGQQRGDGDADLRAGQHERQPLRHLQRPGRGAVPASASPCNLFRSTAT